MISIKHSNCTLRPAHSSAVISTIDGRKKIGTLLEVVIVLVVVVVVIA